MSSMGDPHLVEGVEEEGEEVVVLVLARVGGGGEGTLQDTSA